MAFEKLWAMKTAPRKRVFSTPATINGRPAHEVVHQRRCEQSPRRRITKREFYDRGGFANSRLFRKTDALGRWCHYEVLP